MAAAALARRLSLSLRFPAYSSYRRSPLMSQLPSEGVAYEETHDPAEWKFVEALRPRDTVPPAPKKGAFPSGWKPQSAACALERFYVARTKNHMLPIYMNSSQRGNRKITKVRKVQGDAFALGAELKERLQREHDRTIAVRVHEACGFVEIKGDYYYDAKRFLEEKGF